MKKKLISLITVFLLSISFILSACGVNSNNTDNNTSSPEIDSNTTDNNNLVDNKEQLDDNQPIIPDNNENMGNISSKGIITDWASIGIFTKNPPKYEFDFSYSDTNFSYEIGSAANEALFADILSGEKNYKDYFYWFSLNPDYIYRFNEECYKAADEIISEGAFTQQLQDKYFGLVVNDTACPYFSAIGIETESYQIYFNNDWSIKYIQKSVQFNIRCNAFERWHYSLIGYTLGKSFLTKLDGEVKQYDQFIDPYYENQRLLGYNITSAHLLLVVDMGNGKSADCSVDVTYKSKIVTEFVWSGQKQKHEQVTFLSLCRITADFNNVYSGGFEMFDRILIFAKQIGSWNLFSIWEQYREEVLTPSLNNFTANEQKIYQLA